MPKAQRDVLQGTLDLLVLKVLSKEPLHGYAIAGRIQQISDSALRVEEGSLYPALHRMEEDGWVKAEWSKNELGRRVRVYAVTKAGLKQLADEERRWADLSAAVGRVLRYA
jgi:PadR family transcriptional regulator, regulatory protein PadR